MVNEERVKVVRLVGGEEFIAEVEENGDSIKVKTPCTVRMFETEDGKIALSMPPWFGYSKSEEFEISKSQVLATGAPLDELKAGYIQANSKVILPNAGGLLT